MGIVAVQSVEVSDGLGELFGPGVLLSVWTLEEAPEELSSVIELHESPTRVALARVEALLDRIVDDQFGVIRFKDSEVFGAIY